MRIVIDLQGAQTGSRFRGIGRYTLSLAKAIVRNRGQHEVIVAVNGLFPETLDPIFAEFKNLLPQENIRVWQALGPVREMEFCNHIRCRVSEKLREAFLAELRPDVVLVNSLFEGFTDSAIVSVDCLGHAFPTAVVLHDLIPLVSPDENFKADKMACEWYFRKIEFLKRGRLLLANSESSRQEALLALSLKADSVVTISGACDEFFQVSEMAKNARQSVWNKLGIFRPFVMYIGGAEKSKNLNRLIMAYAQLPLQVRQAHQLVFAGKMGESALDCLKLASDVGLAEDELIITQYVEDADLLTLYNTCALFVFPSLHEGFGIPPLEAMACGAPVIGANATSLKEVIGLEEALFDPISVRAISAKINQGLTDDGFRARLVEHGVKHCKTFSWDSSAVRALSAMERFDPQSQLSVSPLLTIEKTAIFAPRRLKILAIKLDHLGDFILAIPAFTKLKARYPYATIDLVVGSWNVPIAEQLKIFDHIYTYNLFKKKSVERSVLDLQALETILKELGEYDIAMDFRRQSESRVLLFETKANLRVGYETFDPKMNQRLDIALKSYPEPPFKTSPHNEVSISRQMLALVDALPPDVNDFITYPKIAQETQREAWTIAIFPKAGTDVREWGSINFIALVDMFLAHPEIKGVNIYFASENEAAEFGFQASSMLHLHIGLKFTDLAESLSKNALCIANNSGGGHVASYLGITSIGIYSGHELPSEWGLQFNEGYVVQRAAECAPCHGGKRVDCPHDLFCLREISIGDMFNITINALNDVDRKNKEVIGKLSLQDNTDTIVRRLVKSIAEDVDRLDDSDAINLSIVISNNHPFYPLSAPPTMLKPNVLVRHYSGLIDWKGFSGIEPEFRWSDGHNSEMRFCYPQNQTPVGTLILDFETFGRQHMMASFNQMPLHDEFVEGAVTLSLPVTNIQRGINTLTLTFPDARVPGNGDERKLGLAIKSFQVYVKEEAQSS